MWCSTKSYFLHDVQMLKMYSKSEVTAESRRRVALAADVPSLSEQGLARAIHGREAVSLVISLIIKTSL